MRISEVSARTGASARSIRHYERLGLLAPGRTDSNYRTFDEADVARLTAIRVLLRNGFSLREMGSFAACLGKDPRDPATALETRRLFEAKAAEIAARIDALGELHGSLRRWTAAFDQMATTGQSRAGSTKRVDGQRPGSAEPSP